MKNVLGYITSQKREDLICTPAEARNGSWTAFGSRILEGNLGESHALTI